LRRRGLLRLMLRSPLLDMCVPSRVNTSCRQACAAFHQRQVLLSMHVQRRLWGPPLRPALVALCPLYSTCRRSSTSRPSSPGPLLRRIPCRARHRVWLLQPHGPRVHVSSGGARSCTTAARLLALRHSPWRRCSRRLLRRNDRKWGPRRVSLWHSVLWPFPMEISSSTGTLLAPVTVLPASLCVCVRGGGGVCACVCVCVGGGGGVKATRTFKSIRTRTRRFLHCIPTSHLNH
jgi:hypothetical protein